MASIPLGESGCATARLTEGPGDIAARLADRCRMPSALWQALDHLGLPAPGILRKARLPATLHLNPQALLTTAQLFAIWNAVEDMATEPGLGIKLVRASDTTGHQPLFLAASYAADFRDALFRILRFKRLSSAEHLQFDEEGGEFSISKLWPYANEPEPLISAETSFAFVVELGRRGTGHHVTPVRVELTSNDGMDTVRSDYFGCPIQHGAPCNRLVLKSADLELPFQNHNAEMLDILTPALTQALSEPMAHSSIADRVKSVLKRRLPSGRPEVADVAHILGMSERTLQRRMTEEGVHFRLLLGEARRELSRELLSASPTCIDEVACLLGYQDTTSFYRAFKDWEGVTPAQWLARNQLGRPLLLAS